MSTQVINFQRPFQIWIYTVSHGQLLLRSNRSDKFATRVDVLFNDVAALQLPTTFDGFVIEVASPEERDSLKVQLGSLQICNRKVFMIHGTNFAGYVVAGSVSWHEDEGHHFDESHFQKSFLNLRV